ncbi:putative G protein alpha chain [Favolaschia claudopus]|uniref:G protein alpha chain n=1 Tax=Favolaschia claudopus TaxID=2862362 RepID=A0AAW0BQG7_9AGAR
MPPLVRQQSRSSIFSWWSDSNPNLSGPTLNLHALAKPLMKLMYHRQAQEFIAQSRGTPLLSDLLCIFSSYLPLNYVSASTKITILAELIDRVDVGGKDELQAIMKSRIWMQIPELLKSSDTELRRKTEIRNVKIIVLGPRDCGKTTLLKGLRSCFAPKAFRAEMDAWRPAIRLNLMRSMDFLIGLVLQSSPSSELKRLAMKIAPVTYQVEETLFSCIAPPEMILQTGWYRFSRVAEFSSPNVLIPFRREHMREEEKRASRLLSACASDMQELWTSSEMQIFLDDLQRICDENYIPTTNDLLRTRVHNPYAEGPEKHDIEGESSWKAGRLTAYEMRESYLIRAHEHVEVTCLFFLIPISAFDEVYQENGIEFNPLEQSFKQWRAICSNHLLASVNLTVLNCNVVHNQNDILRHKIQSGKQFSQYVTSYLDQPNDADAILACSSLLSCFSWPSVNAFQMYLRR